MSKKKKTAAKKRPAGHASDKNCKGCAYHSQDGRGTCNFCYITGKPRGCPVENCTRKVIGEPARLDRDIMLPGSPIPIKELRAARKQQPQKPKEQKPLPLHPWEQPEGYRFKFPRAKAWEMYQAGWSDRQIALALGCTGSSIGKWRVHYGLPTVKQKERANGAE